jgi:high-affinity K+ transport system ATPase subunit B
MTARDPQGRGRCGARARSASLGEPAGRGSARIEAHRRQGSRRRAARRSPCARRPILLGVVHLKDIVKGGIRERFAELRAWASAP